MAHFTAALYTQLERLRTSAMARFRLPMAKTQSGETRPASMSRGHLYRMTGVDLTRVDGVDGFTALKVISEIWHGNNEVGERQPLRFLVGTEPGQSGNRWQGDQLKDEAQRQPSRGSIALGHHALHRSDSALGAFLRRKKARTWERRRPSGSVPSSSVKARHPF